MIQRAVFSYFNPAEDTSNRCGFRLFSDFLYTTALAVQCASRHFKEVYMVSSDWGVEMFKEVGLPVTKYTNSINKMKEVSPYFWAYGKMIAYCEQNKPFVHIDNDVFLWDKLPERILKADLCFQSHEPMDEESFKYYHILREPWLNAPVRPQKIVDNEVYDFAYNCGICGGHNLKFFKEWKECSEEYIFAKKNHKTFFKDFEDILIHQNLFHEQYFAACLIDMHGLREKVEVLATDAQHINDGCPEDRPSRYTHLWGTAKVDDSYADKTKLSLWYMNRALFLRIHKYCLKNDIEIPHMR